MPLTPAGQRARRWLLVAAALLLMLVPALTLRHLPLTRAQTTGICAIPAGNTTTCGLTVTGTSATNGGVAPGGTMTIQLTNPADAIITNVTALPTGCSVTSGANTAIITISCALASNGIPGGSAGTTSATLTEDITFGPSGIAPFVAETVVYNANGPSAPLTAAGSCGALAGMGSIAVCSNTPSTFATASGSVTLTITASVGGQTFSITAAGDVPAFYGTCPLTSPTTFPSPVPPAASLTVTYTCGAGQVTPLTPAPIAVTITNASGVAGTPTEVTTVSSTPTLTPVAATVPCTFLAGFSGATAPCSGVAPATTAAGDTLAVTVTAAVSQTLSITSAPQALGTCPLSRPFPTNVSFPGGSISVAYTCNVNSTIQLGTPITVTVTNGSGVAGTPQLTITANAPNPSAAPPIPSPTTTSVVFTVTPATATPTVIAGQSLTVTLDVPGENNLTPGQAIELLATATSDNTNASIVSFTFSFSDGTAPVTVLPTEDVASASADGYTLHTFAGPGPYIVAVQAVDTSGVTGAAAVSLRVKPTVSYAGLYQPLPAAQASAGTSLSVTLTAVPMIAAPQFPITFSYTAVTEVNPGLSFGLSTGQPQAGTAPSSVNGTLDFGDGSQPQLVNATHPVVHQYANPGAYNATLTATDGFGNAGQNTVQVVITLPVPQPAPTETPSEGAPAPLSPPATPPAGQ